MSTPEEDLPDDPVRSVRPYTVTGGRTRPAGPAPLPLEALVRARAPEVGESPPSGETLERGRILELCRDGMLSVAELSAHLRLPLGAVRVLVGDLAEEGLVVVYGVGHGASAPAHNLTILESVLDGISRL
ncbi:MAG: DUF742 domain-containing protein [Actinomycetota bacterium]